ncbi:MAG: hypothetical protein NFCOHLIN_00594 [Gammaproteobacteria bacterium]|nr:hypothetical protein [Gammaproteobacteria bacterium]
MSGTLPRNANATDRLDRAESPTSPIPGGCAVMILPHIPGHPAKNTIF